jgi:hypothetical protein
MVSMAVTLQQSLVDLPGNAIGSTRNSMSLMRNKIGKLPSARGSWASLRWFLGSRLTSLKNVLVDSSAFVCAVAISVVDV